jgi:hypothetical protein
MTYRDIAFILALKHHLVVSERNIKRILRAEGMGRRKFSPLADVVSFIQSELSGSGVMHGYRMMYGKCKENGLAVRKDTNFFHFLQKLFSCKNFFFLYIFFASYKTIFLLPSKIFFSLPSKNFFPPPNILFF